MSTELLCLLMLVAVMGGLLAGFPVAFSLGGIALIFAGIGILIGAFSASTLTAFPLQIFGLMENTTLVAVPLFIFMGVMLERSKVAEDLLEATGELFRERPGGLAIAVCLVGALLAASTGIVGATVVTLGLLALPTMLRHGYDPALAGGTIAASGSLGQIIPPSIVLVLLGDQISVAYQNAQFQMGTFAPEAVSVNELFAGALLPGLMLVGLYLAYLALRTRFSPQLAPAPAEAGRVSDQRTPGRPAITALVAPSLLIVAVLGSILGGLATPTEAAGVGAVGATMLAGYRLDERRGRPIVLGAACMAGLVALTWLFDLRPQRTNISVLEWLAILCATLLSAGLVYGVAIAFLRTALGSDASGEPVLAAVARSTMVVTAMVFAIIIGARLFTTVFIGFEGDTLIRDILKDLPGGTLGALLLVMLVMFILGFFLDFLEITFIVVPLVAPVLLQMEMPGGGMMNPIWLGIMMAMNLQTSFLTPPFGLSLFYLRGVAPDSVATTDIYRGIIPFVGLQIMALVLLWFAPALAIWLPGVLF